MANVLLIDDDPSLLDMLAMAFEDAGHAVSTALDGEDGLRALQGRQTDLVVSDVNMPRLDGFALCRELRARGELVPVILLTSRQDEIDEALGLSLGADDYVIKPFSPRVLLARVAAVLRRAGADDTPEPIRIRGPLELDAERIAVRLHQTPVAVTVTEFRLLDALTARPGIVRSRGQLLERMREDESVVAERIVDTYIRRLRRKLEAVEPTFDRIETVVGAGYRYRE